MVTRVEQAAAQMVEELDYCIDIQPVPHDSNDYVYIYETNWLVNVCVFYLASNYK